MFIVNLVLLLIALYFAKKEYEMYRIGWAMFWSLLVGWDLHTLLTSI